MSAETSRDQTPAQEFVSREALAEALANEAAKHHQSTANQSTFKQLTKRVFRSTTGIVTVVLFLTAMLAIGFEAVKSGMKHVSGSKGHVRKRRPGHRTRRHSSIPGVQPYAFLKTNSHNIS